MDRPAAVVAAAGLLIAPVVAWAAAVRPAFALAGAVLIAVGVVLFRWPRLGAYAIVAAFPFNDRFVNVGFASMGPADFLCLGVPVVWIFHRLAHSGEWRPPKYWPLLLLYFGLCFASLMLGVRPARSYGAFLRLAAYVFAVALLFDLGRDRDFLHQAIRLLVFTGVVHLVIALPEVGGGSRVQGLVRQSNILAHLLGTSTIAALGLYELESRRWVRVGILGVVGGFLLIIALTVSRGTYVALAIALVWWGWRSRVQVVLAVVVTATLAWVSEGAFRSHVEQIEARLEGDDGRSTVNRLGTAQNALRAIEAHPFLGVGFGQFRELDSAVEITSQHDRSAHNFYLSVSASVGLPGFFTLVLFLGLTTRRLWQRRRAARDAGEVREALVLRTFQGLLIFTALSLLTKDDGGARFWVVVGLVCAAAAIRPAAPQASAARA